MKPTNIKRILFVIVLLLLLFGLYKILNKKKEVPVKLAGSNKEITSEFVPSDNYEQKMRRREKIFSNPEKIPLEMENMEQTFNLLNTSEEHYINFAAALRILLTLKEVRKYVTTNNFEKDSFSDRLKQVLIDHKKFKYIDYLDDNLLKSLNIGDFKILFTKIRTLFDSSGENEIYKMFLISKWSEGRKTFLNSLDVTKKGSEFPGDHTIQEILNKEMKLSESGANDAEFKRNQNAQYLEPPKKYLCIWVRPEKHDLNESVIINDIKFSQVHCVGRDNDQWVHFYKNDGKWYVYYEKKFSIVPEEMIKNIDCILMVFERV